MLDATHILPHILQLELEKKCLQIASKRLAGSLRVGADALVERDAPRTERLVSVLGVVSRGVLHRLVIPRLMMRLVFNSFMRLRMLNTHVHSPFVFCLLELGKKQKQLCLTSYTPKQLHSASPQLYSVIIAGDYQQ